MRPHTLAIYALLLSAANGSSSPTPPTPTSKSILNRLAESFSERQTALRNIRSDQQFMNVTEQEEITVSDDTDENGENGEDEGVPGFFRKRAESKSETATEKKEKGRNEEDVAASSDNSEDELAIQDANDLKEGSVDDSATTKETSLEQKSDKKRFAGFFNMRFKEDEPLEKVTGPSSQSDDIESNKEEAGAADEPNQGDDTDENGEDEGVPGFFRKRMAASKSETATKKKEKGRNEEDMTASSDNSEDELAIQDANDLKEGSVDDSATTKETSLEQKSDKKRFAGFFNMRFKEDEPLEKVTGPSSQSDDIESNKEEASAADEPNQDFLETGALDTEPLADPVDESTGKESHEETEESIKSDAEVAGDDADSKAMEAKRAPFWRRENVKKVQGYEDKITKDVDQEEPIIKNEVKNDTVGQESADSGIIEEPDNDGGEVSSYEELAVNDTSDIGLDGEDHIVQEIDKEDIPSSSLADTDDKKTDTSDKGEDNGEGKDSQCDGNPEDEETQSEKKSDECSGKEDVPAPTEDDELEGKDDAVCDISTKEGNNTTSVFRHSLENALPWLGKKNEGTQGRDGQQQNTSDEDIKSQTPQDEGTMSSNQQNSQGVMPFGGPSSPFIFLSPPPLSRNPHSLGAPRGMPPPSPNANLSGLLHALLPMLSKLLFFTLLSSTSALFGIGEGQVYSPEPSQHFMLERINDRYEKDGLAMKKALENPPEQLSKFSWKLANNQRKSALKKNIANLEKDSEIATPLRPSDRYSRTVIILDVETYDRDMSTVVQQLRDSVSFILSQYHDTKLRLEMGDSLEVVVCIESPGGAVQEFGLAADQLSRLKEAGSIRNDLSLTVCVDKVAASGGYMMACQASKGQLLAAPFSIVGSIGVLRETINIHDVLEKYGVKPLMLKAGDAKVPLTQTTKVTDESIAIVQNNLEKVHDAFRKMVFKSRGEVIAKNFNNVTNGDTFLGQEGLMNGLVDRAKNFNNVTNGDTFLGQEGLMNGLVDRLMTSDEYVAERLGAGDRVLRLHKYDRSKSGFRLSPLDLLLLRSSGLVGQTLSSKLRHVVKVGQQMMRLGTTMGMIKVLDKSINVFKTSRQEPENDI